MNVVDPILEHARTRPHDAALVLPKRRVTWGELGALIHASAAFFLSHGLAPGDRVGLRVDKPLLHLLCALGLAEIGVAHVALSAADGPSQRRAVREKLGLKAVVTDSPAAIAGEPGWILLERIAALPRGVDLPTRPASQVPAATWLILQSSGTTGEPKFAELSHAAAMDRSERFKPLFDCSPHDVFWPASRLDFVVAKQRALHALHAGAALCLPPPMPIGPELFDVLRAAGVTLACGTPSHLHQLLAAGEVAGTLPALRAFEVRSATVSEPLRRKFRHRFCHGLHVVYGTNEGEALAIAPPTLQDQVRDTVGRATASIELEVVDEAGRPVPSGVVGEVRVRGPGVITQYIDNPQASARSFRDGWFHPGDLASMTADGSLVLQGRKDDMMIFDGMNIYPAEIETALLDHPAVKEAAAYPLKHPQFQDVPAAAVTLHSPVSEQELMRHCVERIGVKAPKKLRILEEFPRNAMGKVLKRELALHRP